MTHPTKTKTQLSGWFFIVWLISVSVLYGVTFSKLPTSDGYAWVQQINQHEWEKIFLPNHLLAEFLIVLLKSSFVSFGFLHIDTLHVIQGFNILLSVIAICLFIRIGSYLTKDKTILMLGTVWWSITYSLWYFANGEIHHQGLVLIMAAFLLGMQYHEKPSEKLIGGITCTCVLANLMHQEHILMIVPVLYLLLTTPKLTEKVKARHAGIYLIGVMVLTGLAYGIVYESIYATRESNFIQWALTFLYNGQGGHPMLSAQNWPWLRLIKGTLMSVNYGAQVLVDAIRYPFIRTLPYVGWYLMGTIITITALFCLSLLAMMGSKKLPRSKQILFAGTLVWLMVYKIIVNLRLAPEAPEYHLVSTAPWLLLLLAGVEVRRWRRLVLTMFFCGALSTLSVNLKASILPWKTYGEHVQSYREFAQFYFRKHDFFVSTESSLDMIFRPRWRYFSIKDEFKKLPREEAWQKLLYTIEKELSEKHRVFVYNFIPSPYALRAINFYNSSETMGQDDFKKMFEQLHTQYDLVAVYEYRESTEAEHYFIDQTKEEIWQIRRKN
ncbi:MAG: hypothetical protein COV74_09240 [Candidatus Omnitrophica bacterium CG11_big_fil_rev_8_21_14_0_20_45_26]|uniref:Glycosyltransferase RgtA/B/C/D-like domain-containing protein n=1 Tax=Candidatus Abzuiibacterium crystallinum TaxID=1974748 RepID=A0A2H0LLS9_9BACT|nr:MAG: hypothetical protein COV74_09240 [Candidatus Omnitrophica bacterium CG11_big_fil_rev_8_21_14_0_20_45_26]PIW63255.1 MAG: hypothetical protein COW12_11215 [Candidatus Omnitrophica bacterium CG12_big_fil_rev_8_21_14_0_65_45_16]